MAQYPWMNQRSNISVLCEEVSLSNTMQFRRGQDISNWPWQLAMLQIALVNAFKIIFQLILMPFGEQTYIPQILGGIALGPSFLSRTETLYKLFVYSPKGLMITGMFRALGFMFLLYLLSMRIDVTIMKKCGKLAIVIAISSLLVPLIITTFFAYFLKESFAFGGELNESLPALAVLVATTSFHVILVVLTDLKLLNSELGHLALAASMISGMSSWALLTVIYDVKEELLVGVKQGVIFAQLSKVAIILIIIFIFRPIMLWMVRQTPDGKSLKEPFVCFICLMLLFCAFFGEVTGQHFYFAPVVLGMATPDGPPIVSSLMEKLDCFVETVLVPCYVIDAGRRSNIYLIEPSEFGHIQIVMFVASLSKLASVIIPAFFSKMPFRDALTLGFILNCKGLFDVQLYSRANKLKLITDDNYSILVFASILHAGLFSWLTKLVYDPSRKYIAYRRHKIQYNNKRSSAVRILACIHQQDDVPSVVGLLEESNPTKDEPIEVHVMHLRRSVDGTVPLFIPHRPESHHTHSYNMQSAISRIINAFSQIENRNEGLSMIQYFTSYAPHLTLHDAVCTIALGKTTDLIVLPFLHSDDPYTRIVNKNILQNAPCSVGILHDSGKLKRSILPSQNLKRVSMIFLGGPDDRETLAYAARMAMHPHIQFTLMRLVANYQSDADLIENRRDLNMINEFKLRTTNSRNAVEFEEHIISEGYQTAKLMRSVCNNYDLILVGRRHNPASSLLAGLSEWEEIEELGVVGDMLASKDFNCDALLFVIQQQASVVQKKVVSPTKISKRLSVSDTHSPKFASDR